MQLMNTTVTIKRVFILIYFLPVLLSAQVIPEELLVNWSDALDSYAYKTPKNEASILDFGAVGDGLSDDWQAVVDAIASFDGQLGNVYFPAGNYLFTKPLVLPDSIILKGDGSSLSTLIFNLNNESKNCITIKKNQNASFFSINEGYSKGSKVLIADSAFLLHSGDFVEIRQQNGDWDDNPIGWGNYAVGQMLNIANVIGDTIFLKQELHIDYELELMPQIRRIDALVNSGVQCLKIKRADQPETGGGANVFFGFAAKCMLRGVESDTSAGSHIDIVNSLNILIDGNYIHHAFEYDGASKHGYGITLNNHSSSCLITNNIFRHLRHAMMVKTGSNGNVFSYNYSIEPFRTEWPGDYGGDISLHGHYPFANLFESNVVQNIVTDHYWGPSGPLNTFFRNRSELYGIIMTSGAPTTSDLQNYVGNETTDDSFLHGLYSLTGSHHFEFGNNILGAIIPSGTNDLGDSSYYLTEQPVFWDSDLSWPSIGLPNENGVGTIPAKQRFMDEGMLTGCPDSLTTFIVDSHLENFEVRIWPNPAKDVVHIEFGENINLNIRLLNINGQHLMSWRINQSQVINLPNGLDRGVYILVFSHRGETIARKLMIVRQ